jgi:hypothetical protein
VNVRTSSILLRRVNPWARAALGLCWLGLTLGSCRMRASQIPLGGTHVDETALSKAKERPATAASLPSAEAEHVASKVEAAPAPSASTAVVAAEPSKAPPAGASSGAFQPRPYALHQTWTRLFDLEFNLKVGPGGNVDMKMESHQEARFEVLGASNGALDKLAIEYVTYTSKLTMLGATQNSPEELAGKRFVITFVHDKPDVRDASGQAPPKKQADSVKDDAREPIEIAKALKELSELVAQGKGRGDFSRAGAIALAGGEDDDTKIPSAKATLSRLGVGTQSEKTATLDVAYTLTNVLDDKSVVEVQVSGNMTVLDGPGRYQSSTLQGPMELRSADPNDTQGRGTIKVTTSYKY